MVNVAECSVADRDRAHAFAAARWVEATCPGVTATLSPSCVSLASVRHEPDAMGLAWRCALLNERLAVEGMPRRDGIVAELAA